MLFTTRYHQLLFLLCYIGIIHLTFGLPSKTVDLCGGNTDIDLTPLSNFRSFSWSVVKTFKSLKTTHQIDILTCSEFNSSDNIPENCHNNTICHTISSPSSQAKSIGYVPIKVQREYKTNLVRYLGPLCDDKLQINYTIDIRFICGNNLGYPTYPPISITNSCKTILYWETAAACKGSTSDRSFGINESPCYVVDKIQGRRYDLSPLIRLKGSYKVWSSEKEDFHINVCSEATDKCGPDSSACIRNGNGQLESVGSYKWSNIEFSRSRESMKHDFIELSYKSKTSKCNGPVSTLNESTTNIRFICAKDMPLRPRYPVLVSSLDCRYDIEWVTDYACPQEEVKLIENNCIIGDLDLTALRSDKFYEFKDIKKTDGTNLTILLNVCGSVPNDKCLSNSSVCILKNGSKTSMARRRATFTKADNRLSASYVSNGASCTTAGGNSKIERTIVEFECDPNASAANQPELLAIEECSYLFTWRTKHVCPLITPSQLNCTFASNELGFVMDLSSLTLNNASYQVQRHQHEPRLAYLISSSARILLNICASLSSVALNNTKECAQSAACLVLDKNTFISLGHFSEPLSYNKQLKALQLRYTGGYNPQTKKEQSTLINFHCESWSSNNEPYLIDYEESSQTYTIEFNTPFACPLWTTNGTNCTVVDPLTKFVYNLKPLASKSFYSIKTDRYDFELNVCEPIKNGSCDDGDVAICQKELGGQGRKYSLGKTATSLTYWNTLLNMTFLGGTSYNDANKTPRKSHISFICDEDAQNGFPEFAGEKDRAYFFRWYTSLACPGPVPKVTHCVFENKTHFFDLTPLALDRGNHFAFGKSGTIAYINFCRPLNQIRDNMLDNCKPNSGICLVDIHDDKSISLGEPASHPFLGFDGTIYMLYNNGDPCPHNKSLPITSSVQLICSPDMEEDMSIDWFDAFEDPVVREECTYHFVVRTPLACPRLFHETTLQNCVYTDKRTNLSADLGHLTRNFGDYSVQGANGPQSTFSLNICKLVKPFSETECKDSAVCFRAANNSVVSYGSVNDVKLYFEGSNLHLRYTNGTACDSQIDGRTRSSDIEFICDQSEHNSVPILYFQNHCLAKFQWHTSAVCNLIIPSCSIVDDKSNFYYSLRPLASMSHAWNVTSSKPNEFYMINVCKPLPVNHNCSSSAGACKCTVTKGVVDCSANLGKVSDHELSIDSLSNDLILVYEDGDKLCDGSVAKTQIRFRCNPAESGHSGPQLVSVSDCTHHFVWDTIFACHLQNIKENSVELSLDEDFVVHDKYNGLKWDFHALFDVNFNVTEKTRFNQSDNYTYVFDFQKKHIGVPAGTCGNSAICQVKRADGFSRDIGSFNNWQFSFMGSDLYLNLHSDNSRCGRQKQKNVTSKIRFLCNNSAGVGSPHFVFESQECDYFFTWETSLVCQLLENRPDPHTAPSYTKRSGMSPGWIVFSISLFALFAFAGWLFVSSSSKRDDVVYHIRRLFRRNEAPQIPFRYQQLSR